ncbi:hypothetical protein UCRNP2_5360 [Neofusicoccum parvum UCRNP2]|uniref:Uncharacterized protein n=1 Tax=Botryosphaeria parva (strain UCR-NP2) TaxID=1287680 RepID=R1G8N8_BOTPV|nr:hypothetical protein UCRNP2_5360 [Neofusicoccum parvum UCRNP2]
MAPVSTQRWDRRKLSSVEYEYETLELLKKTLAVFEYLNDPKVQEMMRVLHNAITDELQQFSNAINEARVRNKEPEVPLMQLWDEYTKEFFNDVSIRAHGWMIGRINAVRKVQASKFDMMKAQGALPDSENTKICSRLALLIDIERDADFHFRISRYGFTRASSSSSDQATPSPEKFEEERAKMRKGAEDMVAIFANGITRVRHAMGVGPFPAQAEFYMMLNDQADANKALRGKDPKKRNKLVGPPPQEEKPEPWVRKIAAKLEDGTEAKGIDGFGFVVYRWKQYEGVPWERLEEAITRDLLNWGKGMAGAEQITAKTKLQWIEMAGTDVENYRMHFKSLRESGQLQPGVRSDVFLVVDPHAANAWFPEHLPASAALAYAERHRSDGHSGFMTMSSTRSSALGAMPTDFEPWVLAVDPDFAQSRSSAATDVSGPLSLYPGWLRVQSSLAFEEVYGKAESGILAMEEMWKMAASHPCGVYTGMATEVEARRFLEWSSLRNRAIKWVLDRPDALFYARR